MTNPTVEKDEYSRLRIRFASAAEAGMFILRAEEPDITMSTWERWVYAWWDAGSRHGDRHAGEDLTEGELLDLAERWEVPAPLSSPPKVRE